MPPRILFVNHTSTVSGAEKVLLGLVGACEKPSAFLFERGALSDELSARGVSVFHSQFGTGLNRFRTDSSLTKAIPLSGRLLGIVSEIWVMARRYDLLYANSQKAFTLAAIACALARKPLIWHLHDIITVSHFKAGQRGLQVRLANRYAKAVIGPSRAVTTAFVAAGGKAALAKVVHNGFEVAPQTNSKAELRLALGLPAGPLIGVFSRLAPWKGQHVVARVVAQLKGLTCIAAGDTLFGEDAYGASLRELVETLGISDRFLLLGQRNDVPRLMRAVDIVIHPSVLPEPFATTLLEAMMVGTPIIATDTGGTAEALAGGQWGTLVSGGDTSTLISAIQAILGENDSAVARAKRAAAWAREEYDPEKMRRAVAEVIEAVAAARHVQ
jgi:glycosyltransferase involved in cell wall biosynthesis